jgi:hypothetical protein
MKRAALTVLAVAALTAVFSLGVLSAQQPPQAEPQEVFCSTMKTGQLCSHGTTDALKLTGPAAEQWVAAVRKYNRAVNEATVQLQKEAQTVLTAQQLAEVNRWFAIGVNKEMNKMLQQAIAASAPAAPHKH